MSLAVILLEYCSNKIIRFTKDNYGVSDQGVPMDPKISFVGPDKFLEIC